MGELEWILNADELQRLSVACPGCGTEMTFDMATDFDAREIVCARCAAPLMGIKPILAAYRTFYRLVDEREPGAVRFRRLAPPQPAR